VYPVSVSNTSPCVALNSMAIANNCIGRMLASGGDTKERIVVSTPMSTYAVDIYIYSGLNQWNEPYGYTPLDQVLGGIGAFSFKDGIDNGGTTFAPKSRGPNIEHNEQSYPILYLWRRDLADSGGAGLYRGGNASYLAVIPHKVESIMHDITAWGMAIPTSCGLFGGLPAAPNRISRVQGSTVREMLARDYLPNSISELGGHHELLAQRVERLPQLADDVWITWWCGGAGYGDPLDRDPDLVRLDVIGERISRRQALLAYGVVLTETDDPSVDLPATTHERERRRRAVAMSGVGEPGPDET
jgi:N-methylhydantoinase B